MPAGSKQPVVVHYTEHCPPDVGAAFIWLKNRDPERSRDVQNVEHVMGKYLISDHPMTVEQWAASMSEGRYMEGETEKRAAIFIGPEFGTVQRADLVAAAREAGDAGFHVLIACAFKNSRHAERPNPGAVNECKPEGGSRFRLLLRGYLEKAFGERLARRRAGRDHREVALIVKFLVGVETE
jgi:hypothetical protein